jgi:transposase
MLEEEAERWPFRLAWSQFRRQHQASARRSHQGRRGHAQKLPLGTGSIMPHRAWPLYCTDAHWTRIAPLLPPLGRYRGKAATPHRLVLEGLLWAMRHGASWDTVPSSFGTPKTLGHRYNAWRATGIWSLILAILRQPALPPPSLTPPKVGL